MPPHTVPEANLVTFRLVRIGAGTFLDVEQTADGNRQFSMGGVQRLRVQGEGAALQALERADIGRWSTFPHEGIQSTVTRTQLRTIGFRGNY